jgi:hypothetical protein
VHGIVTPLLLATFLLALSPWIGSRFGPVLGVVVYPNTPALAEPLLRSSETAEWQEGTLVTVIRKDRPGWLKLRDPDGVEGWVAADEVAMISVY